MKTLEQIKDDYAVSHKYVNWEDLVYQLGYNRTSRLLNYIDEVMKIYAMECLKRASENAWNGYVVTGMQSVADDVKQSITNENNIIK